MQDSRLPCFGRGAPISNLRKRFHLDMTEAKAAAFMRSTILDAYDKVLLISSESLEQFYQSLCRLCQKVTVVYCNIYTCDCTALFLKPVSRCPAGLCATLAGCPTGNCIGPECMVVACVCSGQQECTTSSSTCRTPSPSEMHVSAPLSHQAKAVSNRVMVKAPTNRPPRSSHKLAAEHIIN